MNRTILLGVFSLLILTTFAHEGNNTSTRYLKIEADGNETPRYHFVPLSGNRNVTIFIRQQEAEVRLMLTTGAVATIPNIEVVMPGYGKYHNTISNDGYIMVAKDAEYLTGNQFYEVTLVRNDDLTGVYGRYGHIDLFVKNVVPDFTFLGLSAGVQGSATFLIPTDQLYH